MDDHKPLPVRLSDWNDCREVIYQCCKCGASFQVYGHKQQYCHMCGNKIDWSGCSQKCSEEFRKMYDDAWKRYSDQHHDIKQYEHERAELLYKFYIGELQ